MRWLRTLTKMPLIAKGILAADDAARVVELGFDGLIVSNHGGRQVDGSISALDALGGIRDAVGPSATVMMDSGIRRGSDVMKALALGADTVFLGRPYMWALAVGGQEAVESLLLNLLGDTDRALVLCGCKSIRDLNRSCVTRCN
jgi:isopentenyl diphosphate isomerase/L-lactate dehydrogenase-like FMN-dependent dehydrogenase